MRKPTYLPFRDGPARVAPQLKPISVAEWLPPDPGNADWLEEKRALLLNRHDEVFACLPWAEAAADEAAHYVSCQMMGMDPQSSARGQTNLEIISQFVSDDLCVMVERDGQYCLGAASLCAPTYWSLQENIGKPLGGLHQPVPGGDPELSNRVSRVFAGLQPDMVLERFNWTVQLEGERFTPSSEPMKSELAALSPEDASRRLFQRVERQTIRKLPDTGAVLFTIRVCVDPLVPILENPSDRRAFKEAWENTPTDLASYKGWPHYAPAIRFLLT